MKYKQLLWLGLLLSLTSATLTYSRGTDPVKADTTSAIMEHAPKIFIDYDRMDMDHIRREVNFVNYVRDRNQADIYILVTTMRTASGGHEFTLTFTGKNQFAGRSDTLGFNITSFDTQDQMREGFVRTLKLGLIPYMLETPLAERLTIGFHTNGSIDDVKDKWDYWVFRLRVNGSLSGESLRDQYRIGIETNADRITEDWKIRMELDADFDEEKYKIDEDTTWIASSNKKKADVSVARSISDHWSLGALARVVSSTYRNIDIGYEIVPAIEYNIFPYSESTYREIRLMYNVGPSYVYYNEETIYEKMEELLIKQSFQVDVEIKQPWGQIDIRGTYSSFFHDMSKNRLNLHGDLSFNLFEGFSLDVGGSYSKINDQLSLPIRDLELEEILLRRAELATEYSFHFKFGVSYTFGAIYNNIVNPRFGN
jgi:hypothetical protein